jgi:hypothetical protein
MKKDLITMIKRNSVQDLRLSKIRRRQNLCMLHKDLFPQRHCYSPDLCSLENKTHLCHRCNAKAVADVIEAAAKSVTK